MTVGRPSLWWVVAVVAVVVVGPIPTVVGVGVALTLRRWRALRRARIERAELHRSLPDVVDLLRIGAEAGLTVQMALDAVAEHAVGPLAEAVGAVMDRVARGVRLVDALDGLRVDPVVGPLVDALVDAERYGTPLAEALTRVAVDSRDQRRRQAELRARRLPVQLLAPLVACALPATVVLAVVPVATVALDGIAT
jgi:tight adherence protein C